MAGGAGVLGKYKENIVFGRKKFFHFPFYGYVFVLSGIHEVSRKAPSVPMDEKGNQKLSKACPSRLTFSRAQKTDTRE
jgi:hypothetical protein